MKAAVCIARFSISGVPLAQIRLARALARAGMEVELIVGYSAASLTIPDIPGVRVRRLARPKVRSLLPALMAYLRKDRPDLVFSAEDHLNAVMLLAAILTRSKARISASSRVTPFDTYSSRRLSKRWLLKQLMRMVAWRADALTCVSEDMVEQYRQVFGSTRHVCVYNIVGDEEAPARMAEALDDPWFATSELPLVVAAGSLAPWKGFSDLIAAAGRLTKTGRPVRLAILGEGPLRAELQSQIEGLGLEGTVRLIGHADNPLKYFAAADLFALSSHVEGLPNVLVEAMMCGCTPVATDCPTGPREVLQDGRFGYLVPMRDPDALADGILRALESPVPRDRLAEAVQPFSEQAVLRRHFELLGITAPAAR